MYLSWTEFPNSEVARLPIPLTGGEFIAKLQPGFKVQNKRHSYFVYEKPVGVPINERILDFKSMCGISLQVIDFLMKLHYKGYVFNQINSDNIYVNDTGEIQIYNFEKCTLGGSRKIDLIGVL